MGRQVAIIGGGIGGLAAAAALGQDGWQVTVHERDATMPATGTALGVWPSALRALDTIGAGAGVRHDGVRQQAGRFQRPDGSSIAAIDIARLHRRTGDHTYLLSRPALLTILHRAAAATGATVRLGEPVDDPASLDADLVVVADGVFSPAREHLFGPRHRARRSGVTAWRGVVDGLTTDTFVETWGRGVKFGVTPQEGGRTNWYAATPVGEVTSLHRTFGGWAAPVSAVLARIEVSSILRHDVFVTPPLPSFVRGAAVLIGDAAHAMTPDLGRGGCEAVIDAVALASCLRAAATLPAGLRAFDEQRRPVLQRTARIAGMASRLSRMRHALPVRDALLRAAVLAGPPG